jgi:hypothetical protein
MKINFKEYSTPEELNIGNTIIENEFNTPPGVQHNKVLK